MRPPPRTSGSDQEIGLPWPALRARIKRATLSAAIRGDTPRHCFISIRHVPALLFVPPLCSATQRGS
jgi:hypothetical protein